MIHCRVHRDSTNEIEEIGIIITKKSMARFTELINAALNTKPMAHPELKEFGDMLTEGKILQDYYQQMGILKEED